jgi:hypothetical protein
MSPTPEDESATRSVPVETVRLSSVQEAYLRDLVRPRRVAARSIQLAAAAGPVVVVAGWVLAAALNAIIPLLGGLLMIFVGFWSLAAGLALVVLSPVTALLALPFALRERRRILRDVASGHAQRQAGAFVVRIGKGNKATLVCGNRTLKLSASQLEAVKPVLKAVGEKQVFEGAVVHTAVHPALLELDDSAGNALAMVPKRAGG